MNVHAPAKKAFAFSYSRIKNFEACPKRHLEVDLKKTFKEADSDQLTWGNAVHKALELRVELQRSNCRRR